MLSNPQYSNERGGVIADDLTTGYKRYVESGPLYERLLAGEFGPIAPYEPAPVIEIDNTLILRDQLLTFMKEQAALIEVGGVTVNGYRMATDDHAKLRILGATLAVLKDPSFTSPWRTVDGTIITLDATAITQVSDALLGHTMRGYTVQEQVSLQIAQGLITTQAEVLAALHSAYNSNGGV